MANPHFLDILKEKILQKMQAFNGNEIPETAQNNEIIITDFSNLKSKDIATKHINMIEGAIKDDCKSVGNSTIRKLFGMDKNRNNDGDFNESTLDVLSKFVGIESWAILSQKNNHTSAIDPIDADWLKKCLKNGTPKDIKTVVNFVNDLHTPDDKKVYFEPNYNYEKSIGYLLGEAFFNNKKLKNTTLLEELAKTKNGQLHFYESFVVSDNYYMNALKKHYLGEISTCKYSKSKTKAKDYSFACGVLYEHYHKTNKPKLMMKIGARLFGNVSEEQATLAEMQDTRPYARYWSQKMMYLHHNGGNIKLDKIEDKLRSCQGINEISFAISQLVQNLYVLGQKEHHHHHHLIEVYEGFMSAYNPADIYTNDWYLGCMLPMWEVVVKTYIATKQIGKAQALTLQVLQNNVATKDIFNPQMRVFIRNWPMIEDFKKLADKQTIL